MALIDGNVMTELINAFVTDLSDTIVDKALSYNELLLRAVSAFIAAAFLVYLVWRCIEFITDDNPPPITIVFKEIMVLSLLGVLTFGGSMYTSTIATVVMDSGDDLAMAVTGQKAITSIVTMIGGFITKIFGLIGKSAGISIFDFSITTLLSFVALIVAVYVLLKFFIECLGLLLLVKFMSGIMVAIGGLFICAAYFRITRRMFFSWLNLVVNYILTNLLLCIALALLIDVLEKAVTDIKLTSLLVLLCCMKVGGLIIGYIPTAITTLSSATSAETEKSKLNSINFMKGSISGGFKGAKWVANSFKDKIGKP